MRFINEQVFSTGDHIRAVKGERRDGKKERYTVNDVKLKGIVRNQGDFDKRVTKRTRYTSIEM